MISLPPNSCQDQVILPFAGIVASFALIQPKSHLWLPSLSPWQPLSQQCLLHKLTLTVHQNKSTNTTVTSLLPSFLFCWDHYVKGTITFMIKPCTAFVVHGIPYSAPSAPTQKMQQIQQRGPGQSCFLHYQVRIQSFIRTLSVTFVSTWTSEGSWNLSELPKTSWILLSLIGCETRQSTITSVQGIVSNLQNKYVTTTDLSVHHEKTPCPWMTGEHTVAKCHYENRNKM